MKATPVYNWSDDFDDNNYDGLTVAEGAYEKGSVAWLGLLEEQL